MEIKQEYINWDKLPENVTDVRFELITKEGNSWFCHGIEIISRPLNIEVTGTINV